MLNGKYKEALGAGMLGARMQSPINLAEKAEDLPALIAEKKPHTHELELFLSGWI